MARDDRSKRRSFYRIAGELINLGLVFPAAIAVGYVIGFFLDRRLGTGPWLVVVFSAIGAAAAFINLFRVASRIQDENGP